MKRAILFFPLIMTPACRSSDADSYDEVFDSLIRTERAFAGRSVTSGTRTAFLEFFADDGIVFDAGPVNVRTVWEPRPAEGPVLWWGPEIGDVSAAGDLGYTSGPYGVRMTHESEPVAWGHFVSVWRRDSVGTWKVVVDGGITHGPASVGPDSIITRAGDTDDASATVAATDVEANRAALVVADSAYSRSIVEHGFLESLDAFVDEAARFYRNGHLPFVGIQTIASADSVVETSWAGSEARGAIVSSSGDLGCTYGVAGSAADGNPTDMEWSASYYRIWKRNERSEWRVVVDVLIPFAPTT